TTLLRCLNGLSQPDRGAVTLDARPLAEYKRAERARILAYVPQAEPARFPVTVFDAVPMGRRPYLGWQPRRSDLNKVAQTIERAGLQHLAGRQMHQLSGGERQKVAIAKAIAQDPRVLLLDEPTTYLDLEHQLAVVGLLRSLASEGVTVIMTIHDLNLALAGSDQIVVMQGGRISLQGPPGALTPEVVESTYNVPCSIIKHEGTPVVFPHTVAL